MLPVPVHLGLQAKSDMKQAHATARADRSGHALACAMLLGQQAVEKHLKAIVLMAAEVAGIGGVAGLGRSLGHDVYPRISEFYVRHAGRLSAPCPKAGGSGSHAAAIRCASDFWRRHAGNRDMQETAWRRSIGALPDGDRAARLDAVCRQHAGELARLVGMIDAGMPLPSGDGVPVGLLREDVLCGRTLSSRQRAHLKSRWNASFCMALERQFGSCRASLLRKTSGNDSGGRKRLASCLAAGFGLASLAMLSPCYVYTYPHAILGRYPGILEDGFTPDIYESHSDAVLSFLFVDIPCHMNQIGRVGSRVLALRDACGSGEQDEPAA